MFFLGKMLFPKKFDMKNMTYPDYSSSFGQPWAWRGSSKGMAKLIRKVSMDFTRLFFLRLCWKSCRKAPETPWKSCRRYIYLPWKSCKRYA